MTQGPEGPEGPRIDEAEVRKLAALAHISLSEKEAADFTGQLEQILGYAARIVALDTEGVEPTSHALLEVGLQGAGVLRDDVVTGSLERDDVLERAPDSGDDLFRVPKVIP